MAKGLGHQCLRACAAAISIAVAIGAVEPALAATNALPTLGDVGELTPAAERKLGERIVRELFRDPDYIDDAVLADYVQGLWEPLLAAARTRGELPPEMDQRFAWQILLGKDRTINAFALPGGWLGLHLGLIGATVNRDELASVLAHELSHVTQRHVSRLVSQQKRQMPLVIAGMILGALAAAKSPDAANAAIVGGQAVAAQNQLNFSRDMEREADRVGFGVMTQAGFQAQGFVTMFDKLQQASRLNDNGSFPYLRTHPMTTERIAEMQSRQQLATRGGPLPTDVEHSLMAARARVLSNSGNESLRNLANESDSLGAQAPAAKLVPALYASALAASKLRDAPAAAKAMARLTPLVAADARAARTVNLLAAELALANGDAKAAAALVEPGVDRRPELLLWAQAAEQTGHAPDAAQKLQTWVTLHKNDATAWLTLGAAYAAQGQQVRAVRSEAEAQVAWLDYAAAMDRFKAAQELARRGGTDHIELSILDTRARQVQSLLREQALER